VTEARVSAIVCVTGAGVMYYVSYWRAIGAKVLYMCYLVVCIVQCLCDGSVYQGSIRGTSLR